MRKSSHQVVLWLLRLALLVLATMLSLVVTAQGQRVLRVPAELGTIQAGIDAARPGDTVLVAPGTWHERLDLHGKAITVASAEGQSVTMLVGDGLGPAVAMTGGETRSTLLRGFTITNGAPGVLVRSSSPTIDGNILSGNLCAGLDAKDSAPLVTGNTIAATQPCAGSAPILLSGSATLTATLRHNVIEHNGIEYNDATSARAAAGAIALRNAAALLDGNIIRYNTSAGDVPTFSVVMDGALVPSVLEQNLIYANATHCGSTVALSPGPAAAATVEVEFLNNTVADNPSDCAWPAADLRLEALPGQIALANNLLTPSPERAALDCSAALPPEDFRQNLVHNPSGPLFAAACAVSALVADPLYVSRQTHDYHLAHGSPARDAGAASILLPAEDLDAQPRTRSGRLDLGPYEYAVARALAATTTLLNASPAPAEAYQSMTLTAQVATTQAPIPTGSVTFTASGQTLATVALDSNGVATFTTTTLAEGSWTLTGAYTGSAALAPSSSTLVESVNPATVLVSFAVTPSTADATQSVTLSALVKAPLSSRVPAGRVQFLELHAGGAPSLLATLPVDATGRVSTTLTGLATGTHLIDAAFLGTADFASVTLSPEDALTLTIAARDYTLSLAPTTLTLQSQHNAAVALTLTSVGSWAGDVTLSCANLPASASCTFTPQGATLSAGGSARVSIQVDTDTLHGYAGLPPFTLLLLLPLARRRRRTFLRLLPLVAVFALGGCSGMQPAHTPAGTYQVLVTAQAAGGTAHTAQLTLVVTP